MIFLEAFLWGTGISLGMCVGLMTWGLIRPMTPGSRVARSIDRKSIEALQERNILTIKTNVFLERTAKAAENNALLRAIADKMPKTGDRETILLGDIIWMEVPESGNITQGFVESISNNACTDECRGAYTIGWATASRKSLHVCGNLDCYSTREALQAAQYAR